MLLIELCIILYQVILCDVGVPCGLWNDWMDQHTCPTAPVDLSLFTIKTQK